MASKAAPQIPKLGGSPSPPAPAVPAPASLPSPGASESASTNEGDGEGLFSTRNLIIGGVLLSGVIAAIVSLSFRNSKSSKKTKSKSKSKSKSKKSEKSSKKKSTPKSPTEKTGTSAKTGAAAPQPAPQPAAPQPAAPQPAKDDAKDDAKDATKDGKADTPKKDEGAPSNDDVATVEDTDESGTADGDLQTEGPVSNEVFQNFLKESNAILKKSEMKDTCAALYKSGGNVGKYLQQEQGKLWKKLGIDPEYGVKKLAESISSRSLHPINNRVLQESLLLEEVLFNYAYHGSQEAVDAAAARVKRLLEQSRKEIQDIAMEHKGDQAAMQKYMTNLMSEYKKINEELKAQNVSDPMVTTEIKSKMSDEKMLVLLKGQIVIMQHQQMMRMMQQRPNPGTF